VTDLLRWRSICLTAVLVRHNKHDVERREQPVVFTCICVENNVDRYHCIRLVSRRHISDVTDLLLTHRTAGFARLLASIARLEQCCHRTACNAPHTVWLKLFYLPCHKRPYSLVMYIETRMSSHLSVKSNSRFMGLLRNKQKGTLKTHCK